MERLALPAAVLFGILFFVVVGCGLMAPPAYDALQLLRRLYPKDRVELVTLKSPNLEQSCGLYRVAGGSVHWKYIDTRDGLWAEELSRAWRVPAANPYSSAELNRRWEACIHHRSRGDAMDWILSPLLVFYMNST